MNIYIFNNLPDYNYTAHMNIFNALYIESHFSTAIIK